MLVREKKLCQILYFGMEILNCYTLQGVLCRTLEGHAHWVNTLALSTDYVLRTGPFDPVNPAQNSNDRK